MVGVAYGMRLWVWVGWGNRVRLGAECGWAEVDVCYNFTYVVRVF